MSNHEGFRDPTADEAVGRTLRKNRKKRPASDETVRKSDPQKKNGEGIKPLKAPNFTRKFPLPLVYISSPFGDGKVKKDREQVLRAKLYCRFAITRSCVPVAPRLLYPGFLRDEVKPEREIGNICGMCLLDKCSEVWVFGETLTQDMKWEIWRANMRGKPIRWFTEGLRKVEKDLPADCKTLTGPVARKKKEENL